MEKLYDRIYWHNNTTPALNETNLNAMSKAIDDIDDRVVELAADIMETVPEIGEYLDQAQELVEDIETLTENPPYIGANGNWYVWNTETGEYVDSGVDASITVDIADITMLPPSSSPYVTNTGTSTDPVFHLYLPKSESSDQVSNMPTASAEYENAVYQYVGATTASYIKGHFYQCVSSGSSYQWVEVPFGNAVSVEHQGTASAAGVRKQTVLVDNVSYDVDGSAYMEQTITTSTSANASATFTNAMITANSLIDVYTSQFGLDYSTLSISAGSCTVTFPAQASAASVTVRIYIRG